MKSTRTRRAVAAVGAAAIAASIGLAGVAIASPSTGTITPVTIGAGRMATGMGFVAHPGTNTIVAQYTFGPNSSTGWHSHPGKTLVTVQSGTFTVYHDDCHAHTYGPGDAFVDRETERIRFRAATWWDVTGSFAPAKEGPGGRRFDALLVEVGGRRVAAGRDFDPTTGARRDVTCDTNFLSPDGIHAMTRGERSLELIDLRDGTRRPIAGIALAILQQVTGINVFLYFGAFSLWSFGYKLYRYGHDLSPTAAASLIFPRRIRR